MSNDDFTTIDAFRLGRRAPERRVSLVIYHRDGAEITQLVPQVPVVVGRSAPADVALPDPSLSRQHARFWRDGDAIWVEDLESTNGTKINGRKTHKGRLKPDDEVQLGAVSATVHVLDSMDPELSGVESHDQFVRALEEEIVRAHAFNRPISLLMVRASKRNKGHLSHWAPGVRQLLRPVDRMALYGPSCVLISMPEVSITQAERRAAEIVAKRAKTASSLFIGVATYPQSATSAGALVDAAREAAHQGRTRKPIQIAPDAFAPPSAVGVKHASSLVIGERSKAVFETAKRAAAAQIPIFIVGETGTGKEVLARFVHEQSDRGGELCCINCGAIPKDLIESTLFGHEQGAFTGASARRKGVFEAAQGGTVLLDEIGELSAPAQAALLRVLESKCISRVGSSAEIEVDVRILAATHRDLEQMCERGEFRWDLLYRLNTMPLELPPLRKRRDEIQPLAQRFMQQANATNGCEVHTIDEPAQALLQRYPWPGNVRELRNVIERAVVIARDNVITPADLSDRVRRGIGSAPAEAESNAVSIKDKVQQYEAKLLLEALEQHHWNQTETAKALGMPLRTLVHKIKLFDLNQH